MMTRNLEEVNADGCMRETSFSDADKAGVYVTAEKLRVLVAAGGIPIAKIAFEFVNTEDFREMQGTVNGDQAKDSSHCFISD